MLDHRRLITRPVLAIRHAHDIAVKTDLDGAVIHRDLDALGTPRDAEPRPDHAHARIARDNHERRALAARRHREQAAPRSTSTLGASSCVITIALCGEREVRIAERHPTTTPPTPRATARSLTGLGSVRRRRVHDHETRAIAATATRARRATTSAAARRSARRSGLVEPRPHAALDARPRDVAHRLDRRTSTGCSSRHLPRSERYSREHLVLRARPSARDERATRGSSRRPRCFGQLRDLGEWEAIDHEQARTRCAASPRSDRARRTGGDGHLRAQHAWRRVSRSATCSSTSSSTAGGACRSRVRGPGRDRLAPARERAVAAERRSARKISRNASWTRSSSSRLEPRIRNSV